MGKQKLMKPLPVDTGQELASAAILRVGSNEIGKIKTRMLQHFKSAPSITVQLHFCISQILLHLRSAVNGMDPGPVNGEWEPLVLGQHLASKSHWPIHHSIVQHT